MFNFACASTGGGVDPAPPTWVESHLIQLMPKVKRVELDLIQLLLHGKSITKSQALPTKVQGLETAQYYIFC